MSAWTSTVHTEPGRYLPSWPTKNTPPAGARCSGEPRSARITRHPTIVSHVPSAAGTNDSSRAPMLTRCRSWLISVQFRATPHTSATTTATATTMRTILIVRERVTGGHPRVGLGQARVTGGAA